MAIDLETKSLKLQLKLEEGTQTIPHCNALSNYEGFYALGMAVAKLINSPLEEIVLIENAVLVNRA